MVHTSDTNEIGETGETSETNQTTDNGETFETDETGLYQQRYRILPVHTQTQDIGPLNPAIHGIRVA